LYLKEKDEGEVNKRENISTGKRSKLQEAKGSK